MVSASPIAGAEGMSTVSNTGTSTDVRNGKRGEESSNTEGILQTRVPYNKDYGDFCFGRWAKHPRGYPLHNEQYWKNGSHWSRSREFRWLRKGRNYTSSDDYRSYEELRREESDRNRFVGNGVEDPEQITSRENWEAQKAQEIHFHVNHPDRHPTENWELRVHPKKGFQ
ncbi:uncharacterized protein PAC_06829 [Phialocephala subalpina]|uniref:Uncharacterized protein n=1 Tax=Phialocephala subalpina TaxID=576137 RepID=A0A1L7WVZ2_9HELO|nr:uncharacterized protein PAC_06829 [Phialocephala subalpina]